MCSPPWGSWAWPRHFWSPTCSSSWIYCTKNLSMAMTFLVPNKFQWPNCIIQIVSFLFIERNILSAASIVLAWQKINVYMYYIKVKIVLLGKKGNLDPTVSIFCRSVWCFPYTGIFQKISTFEPKLAFNHLCAIRRAPRGCERGARGNLGVPGDSSMVLIVVT